MNVAFTATWREVARSSRSAESVSDHAAYARRASTSRTEITESAKWRLPLAYAAWSLTDSALRDHGATSRHVAVKATP